jgi:hypothetical protein
MSKETTARMKQLLDRAKPVTLTDEENEMFLAINRHRNWDALGYAIAKVSERAGLELQSGRVAYDEVNKRLLVID